MPAPTWLTSPDKDQSLLLYAVPVILIGSYATNKYMDTRTDRDKAKVLIASGMSIIVMLGALAAICDGSTQGLCHFVPEEFR